MGELSCLASLDQTRGEKHSDFKTRKNSNLQGILINKHCTWDIYTCLIQVWETTFKYSAIRAGIKGASGLDCNHAEVNSRYVGGRKKNRPDSVCETKYDIQHRNVT